MLLLFFLVEVIEVQFLDFFLLVFIWFVLIRLLVVELDFDLFGRGVSVKAEADFDKLLKRLSQVHWVVDEET